MKPSTIAGLNSIVLSMDEFAPMRLRMTQASVFTPLVGVSGQRMQVRALKVHNAAGYHICNNSLDSRLSSMCTCRFGFAITNEILDRSNFESLLRSIQPGKSRHFVSITLVSLCNGDRFQHCISLRYAARGPNIFLGDGTVLDAHRNVDSRFR